MDGTKKRGVFSSSMSILAMKRTYSKQSVRCIQPERVDVLQLKVG